MYLRIPVKNTIEHASAMCVVIDLEGPCSIYNMIYMYMLNIQAWHVYVHWKSLFMVYICARMCLLNTIFADGLISVGLILMNERFSLFEEIGIQKGINILYRM